ncbi:Sodium/solute symporter superfamily [Sesbania bispinosa]|nr:Sodium/solute symporter superfamily [Sesbania bispinosa]
MAPLNITNIKTSSNGVWQGDNPLNYAFPTPHRSNHLSSRRQPRPRFPLQTSPTTQSHCRDRRITAPSMVVLAGTYVFTILRGRSGEDNWISIPFAGAEEKAFTIAAVGISVPFIGGIGVAFVLRKTIEGADKVGFGQFIVFMGVALSITAFPVLARILAELKLLTTRVGETAMAAAAFNDVAAWILLALAIALAGNGNGESKSPLVSIWVLLSGAAFVVFMMVVIGPLMTVSRGDALGRMRPLMSGLKTDVTKIRGGKAWGLLALVISTACAGKILGTFIVAIMCRIPAMESLTLGVLMNTKGLVELIVLNIGKEKKVLNDEIFAILVLMALFTTFITTPLVMAIYKPARGITDKTCRKLGDLSSHSNKKDMDELRVLACIHGPSNIPPIISLIESTRGTKSPSSRSSSCTSLSSLNVLLPSSWFSVLAKTVFPFFNRFNRDEWYNRLAGAFQAYSQLGRVSVRSTTAISSLSTMHEDICHVAEEKRVTMILLPFHKQWRMEVDNDDNEAHVHEVLENAGHEWRGVNQRVLKNAPCSVAVLVDRGHGIGSKTPGPNTTEAQRICIVFFGGPDDREALELGKKMAEHPTVEVTVVRFVEKDGLNSDNELDEKAMAEFRSKWEGTVKYMRRFPSNMVAELAEREAEHAELGPIGDILASSTGQKKIVSSVLVIQQHDVALMEEAPMCKVHDENIVQNLSFRGEISVANDNAV